jgi:hypothetical protein
VRLPPSLETAAAAWLCTAARGVRLAADGALLVSYAQLRDDLAETLARICGHFGIPATPRDLQQACQVRKTYAKDPRGELPFVERSAPAPLGQDLRAAIERLSRQTEDALEELTARGPTA